MHVRLTQMIVPRAAKTELRQRSAFESSYSWLAICQPMSYSREAFNVAEPDQEPRSYGCGYAKSDARSNTHMQLLPYLVVHTYIGRALLTLVILRLSVENCSSKQNLSYSPKLS